MGYGPPERATFVTDAYVYGARRSRDGVGAAAVRGLAGTDYESLRTWIDELSPAIQDHHKIFQYQIVIRCVLTLSERCVPKLHGNTKAAVETVNHVLEDLTSIVVHHCISCFCSASPYIEFVQKNEQDSQFDLLLMRAELAVHVVQPIQIGLICCWITGVRNKNHAIRIVFFDEPFSIIRMLTDHIICPYREKKVCFGPREVRGDSCPRPRYHLRLLAWQQFIA